MRRNRFDNVARHRCIAPTIHCKRELPAIARRIKRFHHLTGAPFNSRACCLRCANQRREQRGFSGVQAMWRLAEQHLGRSADALNFTSKENSIQIGFKNLLLAPYALKRPRRLRLIDFLFNGSTVTRTRERLVHRRRNLHRDTARTTRSCTTTQIADSRRSSRTQVHATVIEEALVFRCEHRINQRWRNFIKRSPRATPDFVINTYALNRCAVAVEDETVAGGVGVADGVECNRHRSKAERRKERCRQSNARSSYRMGPPLIDPEKRRETAIRTKNCLSEASFFCSAVCRASQD